MSQNLTMSPDLGTEDWDPDVITRMIFIGPGAHVSEQEVVTAFHMLGLPLTIKNTCYGSMISGKSEQPSRCWRCSASPVRLSPAALNCHRSMFFCPLMLR